MSTFFAMLITQVVLPLAGTVAAAAVARLANSKYHDGIQETQWMIVEDAVKAAVHETWREYTEAIKAAAADGKLTREEMKEARQIACDTALRLAKEKGVDALRVAGSAGLSYLLEKAYAELKELKIV